MTPPLLLCRGANPNSNTGELSLRLAALRSRLQVAEQQEKELDLQKERMHQCLKNFVDSVSDEEYLRAPTHTCPVNIEYSMLGAFP